MIDNPWEVLRRTPNPDLQALAPAAVNWVLALPPQSRPHALAKKHPQVVNWLAARWPRRAAARRIAQWLATRRAYRHALSYDALADLRMLAEHLQEQSQDGVKG